MEASAETIWEVPAYLPYVQSALTDEAIAEAEAAIGYALPDEYLALLRVQNGGYIRLRLPENVHSVIAGIGKKYPSITDVDWEEVQEWVDLPLDGLVPFDGDGHWHMCFDYRKNSNRPSVTYLDIECERESEIASTFSEYLSQLRVEVNGQFVLEGVRDIEEAKTVLSSKLRTSFEPPDSWNHGFPVHRASVGASRNHDWMWISPNRVPKEFSRVGEFASRRGRIRSRGQALRYPTLSEDCFILTMTDGARKRVLNACAKAEISARPMSDLIEGV